MSAFKARRGMAGVVCLAMSLLLLMAGAALAASPVRSDPFAQQATLTASEEIGKSPGLRRCPLLRRQHGPDRWTRRQRRQRRGRRSPAGGSAWTQQGAKLTGAGEVGLGLFGVSVALSADGNTALIGSPGDHTPGAAWVFTRSGSTWTQQGPKLIGSEQTVPSSASAWRCRPMATPRSSAAMATTNGVGAAWVFTRSDSTWTQPGKSSPEAGRAAAQFSA